MVSWMRPLRVCRMRDSVYSRNCLIVIVKACCPCLVGNRLPDGFQFLDEFPYSVEKCQGVSLYLALIQYLALIHCWALMTALSLDGSLMEIGWPPDGSGHHHLHRRSRRRDHLERQARWKKQDRQQKLQLRYMRFSS